MCWTVVSVAVLEGMAQEAVAKQNEGRTRSLGTEDAVHMTN